MVCGELQGVYCKSSIFGCYKIWQICYILSDIYNIKSYLIFVPTLKLLNSTPNLVDLQYLIKGVCQGGGSDMRRAHVEGSHLHVLTVDVV